MTGLNVVLVSDRLQWSTSWSSVLI